MKNDQINAPMTPQEINMQLQSLKLPVMTDEQIQAVFLNEPHDRLYNALCHAKNNTGALQYLRNITERYVSSCNTHSTEPQTAESNTEDTSRQRHRNQYHSYHVYGKKAALSFSATTFNEKSTINLDGALASAPRKYDWNNKICIAMTQTELPIVASVILGLSPKAEFTNHGKQNNKSFCIAHQDKNLFITMTEQNKKMVAVPVPLSEAFYIATLFLKQICQQSPWMQPVDVVQCLRLTTGRQ